MTVNSMDEMKTIKILISQIRAFCETINDILYNANTSEIGRYSSFRDMAHIYNDFAEEVRKVLKAPSMIYTFNIEDMPGYGDSVWGVQKKILEQVLISAKMLLSTLEGNIDFIDDEFDNIENFIAARLRTVIFSRPEKEVEVQNALESLLLGRGLNKGTDYDRETGKFEFSGKEFIPDFIVPKMNLCVEIKLLRDGKKSRIIEEISADITAYRKNYQRQLYIVYDLGVIQNEIEFKRDIEKSEGVKVIVVKH